MPAVLTSRQVRTIEWLFSQDGPRSISDAASDLQLSPRVVRSCLDGIERFLAEFEVQLHRRRGLGIWLEATPDALDAARISITDLAADAAVKVYSAADRRKLALFDVLVAAPDSRTVDRIAATLHVSVTSARRDVARAEPWLSEQGLVLTRRPGLGLSVVGTETAIRRSLVKLILESVPLDRLARDRVPEHWFRIPNINAGVRDVLQKLPLRACHSIVHANEVLRSHARRGHPWLAADLAVTVFRIRSDKTLVLEPGVLRSLEDHPVWETATAVARELAQLTGAPLSESEIGGITEHLLGMAELRAADDAMSDGSEAVVQEAIRTAATALHPGLAEDAELARSLRDHFERLSIRIKYGLPVHNPLLRDVTRRYPEVHEVAATIAEHVGRTFDAKVTEDEAGYITMYLSGAMERLRLKPRRRAVVVCPTGVATAWILVSRIQAEFPELDLVEVLSAGSIDDHGPIEADVVISTVDLDAVEPDIPVLVVNPLLPSDDVRKLAQHL